MVPNHAEYLIRLAYQFWCIAKKNDDPDPFFILQSFSLGAWEHEVVQKPSPGDDLWKALFSVRKCVGLFPLSFVKLLEPLCMASSWVWLFYIWFKEFEKKAVIGKMFIFWPFLVSLRLNSHAFNQHLSFWDVYGKSCS